MYCLYTYADRYIHTYETYVYMRILYCIYIYAYEYDLIQNEEQRGAGLQGRCWPRRTSGSMADVLVLIVSIDKKAITASDFSLSFWLSCRFSQES